MDPIDLDAAVAGESASGTYSAWRLQQEKGATESIDLFMYGDRIGGRLYTATLPGSPDVKAEVCGMSCIPRPAQDGGYPGGPSQACNKRFSRSFEPRYDAVVPREFLRQIGFPKPGACDAGQDLSWTVVIFTKTARRK